MGKHMIEKSNKLNLFFATTKDEAMTLTELRFFCMYLSKLNARNPEKRVIDIPISEFEKIFNVKINSTEFTKQLKNILRRVLYIKENEDNILINLYSKFQWSRDNPQTITVACNSDIIPFLFELKNNYTSYRLENISKLNSASKIRLYELMKQYEKMGRIKINVDELLEMLFCTEKIFKNFRIRVLEPAIADINEYTDITVTYEKVLKCRKCIAIKFFIVGKNNQGEEKKQKVEQLENPKSIASKSNSPKDLKDLYRKYFSDEQDELIKRNIKSLLQDVYSTQTMIDKKTKAIYDKSVVIFKSKAQSDTIKNPMAYITGIFNNIIDDERRNSRLKRKASYDLAEIEKCAINAAEIAEIEKLERGEITKIENQAVTKPVAEKNITIPDKTETADREPVGASDEVLQEEEPYNKYFKTMREETELFIEMQDMIKTISNYDDAVKILDAFDIRWRNFEFYCQQMILDELAKKDNAPKTEIIEIT